MKTISSKDLLFATVSVAGKVIANLRVSGIDSVKQLLGYVRETVGRVRGVVTLRLRNATMGWSDELGLMLV